MDKIERRMYLRLKNSLNYFSLTINETKKYNKIINDYVNQINPPTTRRKKLTNKEKQIECARRNKLQRKEYDK